MGVAYQYGDKTPFTSAAQIWSIGKAPNDPVASVIWRAQPRRPFGGASVSAWAVAHSAKVGVEPAVLPTSGAPVSSHREGAPVGVTNGPSIGKARVVGVGARDGAFGSLTLPLEPKNEVAMAGGRDLKMEPATNCLAANQLTFRVQITARNRGLPCP